ncbi:hypothetical protein QRX50_26820 [Amycolatopsis carbonis]|uniref:Uncharacterized protein n=1 Tax=Amycolatopsis carbonis TaxID=715471 RepID=A0A9Y2MZ56_9PSEU|nr:hypothetical protein [Amycolatopsis sp. 2-15]WIX84251.1 hypothetical protein QRX50_26820 [Amycolatopsis sp. 2-15]
MCANIGSAPSLSVFGVTVAACPPLALLLAVELLNRAMKDHHVSRAVEIGPGLAQAEGYLRRIEESVCGDDTSGARDALTAEERMWQYYVEQAGSGREPSSAELDRVAGTHNYGRRVLRRWKESGRTSSAAHRRLITRLTRG